MKMDLHIHSKYSYDSFSEPSQIIKIAKRKGLDVISITDHNTMSVYDHISQNEDLIIIPGMEIKTDMGDIIGLFLQNEVKSRSYYEVVDEIRAQDGVVVLPHPFRRPCKPQILCDSVDMIEVINSRSNDSDNKLARSICEDYRKIPITGSDAHIYFEIGMAITEIYDDADNLEEVKKILFSENRHCYGGCTPYYLSHGCSYIISKIKRW